MSECIRPAAALGRALTLALLALGIACQSPGPPLAVVENVDLSRYVGRWYEIASFPQSFQRGCVATTATYSLRDDGRIRVVNECRNETFDGDLRSVEGVAWVTDPSEGNAKLQVQFFWPFHGDYWIIELDPDYGYAAIGHPSRDYLWILSRTPTLDPRILEPLVARIAAKGFEIDRLETTLQPSAR